MASRAVAASLSGAIRAQPALRARGNTRRSARHANASRTREPTRAAAPGDDWHSAPGDGFDAERDAYDRLSKPLTPGDLHRAAAAAAAEPGFDANAARAADDYPFSLDEHSASNNSVGGSVARGVCWSNLQDLEDVPDHEPVYILVFGAGTGSEGLYSLQERTKEDVPVDIILAFPSEDDAARYGTLLEAEMGRVPVVESARPEDLRYTCREGGYRCKVARRGVLLMPPEKTVEVTDWERTNALRQGQWSVDATAGSDVRESDVANSAGCRALAEASSGLTGDDLLAQYQSILDGYCDGAGAEDELCELPGDYDEDVARDMLSRLFTEHCDVEDEDK